MTYQEFLGLLRKHRTGFYLTPEGMIRYRLVRPGTYSPYEACPVLAIACLTVPEIRVFLANTFVLAAGNLLGLSMVLVSRIVVCADTRAHNRTRNDLLAALGLKDEEPAA